MNPPTTSIWLRLSERAFAFNFIAFSFVMFSCLFPTGFAATFSTFSFLFAIPIFCYQFRCFKINRFELVGLALFGWLSLSIFWSNVPFLESMGYLSEYRIYIMIPVLTSAIVFSERTQRWALVSALLGAFLALVASYGLGFGWWEVEGADRSLANRIYHGFIMSSFLLVSLLIAREASGAVRLIAAIVALLVLYNVLNIETGRTGYIQVASVVFVFLVLTFRLTQAVFMTAGAVILFGLSYMSFDRFHDRVNETVVNVEKMVASGDVNSSAGLRLEFYRAAFDMGMDNSWFGVGVGEVTKQLRKGAESGDIRVLTDNVHNEFLNMLLAGGGVALLLFTGFVSAIGFLGVKERGRSRVLGDALIGVSVILTVAALFNSTIKDFGEKHALMIMLSILGARVFANTTINESKHGVLPRFNGHN